MKALPLLMLLTAPAWAQVAPRDPTAWPDPLRQSLTAPRAASGAEGEPAPAVVQQIVLSEGRAYAVVQGRRYGVGERLGAARIERIDERGVWLRESGQLRREPLFTGVEKRTETNSTQKKSKEKS